MNIPNSKYFDKIIPSNVVDDSEKEQLINEAYKQASDIRKFEIELFWSRATYFWAFILAAFTAHFSLLGIILSKGDGMDLSIKNLWSLSGLSLFALAITAFFCFIFSFAWVLVNKGSKYWQKNWECHIDELEPFVTGNLYKTYLNTEYKYFSKKIFNIKPYDYSVTKITMMTSVLLMIVSFLLSVFYLILLFLKYHNVYIISFKNSAFCVVSCVCLLLFVFVAVIFYYLTKSSNFNKEEEDESKWYSKKQ